MRGRPRATNRARGTARRLWIRSLRIDPQPQGDSDHLAAVTLVHLVQRNSAVHSSTHGNRHGGTLARNAATISHQRPHVFAQRMMQGIFGDTGLLTLIAAELAEVTVQLVEPDRRRSEQVLAFASFSQCARSSNGAGRTSRSRCAAERAICRDSNVKRDEGATRATRTAFCRSVGDVVCDVR